MQNTNSQTQLNEKQLEAVTTTQGPVLVIAGAGSGKTKVLTQRIAYIISSGLARPEEILAVTFTNKAATEIKNRIAKELSSGQNAGIVTSKTLFWAGTFHAICAKILRIDGYHIGIDSSYTIYDPTDQKSIIREILKRLDVDIKKFPPKAVLNTISSAKNELITSDGYKMYATGLFQEMISKIYPEYQKTLESNQALDFDDLIMKTIILFQQTPEVLEKYQELFKYILIDEYQDTNYAQYTFAKLLASKRKNIFVVGDDAQSIYKWRGADIKNILNFENDYDEVKTIKLEQNYRSTKTILEASNKVISYNKGQKKKKLWTDNDNGDLISVYEAPDDRSEAVNIAQMIKKLSDINDIAILYRTNAQSRILEEAMISHQIPYKIVGNVRFYDRKEIKDILAYIRLIANPKDNVSLKRIINTPRRGIGNILLTNLTAYSSQQGLSIFEALEAKDIDSLRLFLSASQLKKIEGFTNLILSLRANLKTMDLVDFLKGVLERSNLLEEYNDKSEESLSKIENIKEFVNISVKYKGEIASDVIESFLEDISLLEEQAKEADKDTSTNKATLMTIHAAKGLEFDYVFVCGLEENIFPHSRSYADPDELEEERRLAYVAFTRAKKKLYLSYASRRSYMGSYQDMLRSRFIDEIPEGLIEYIEDCKPVSSSFGYIQEEEETSSYYDTLDICQGSRVRSEYFGIGEVIYIDDEIIRIKFASGIKELAKEYARLELV